MLVGNDEGAAVLEAVFMGRSWSHRAWLGGRLRRRLAAQAERRGARGWEAFPVKAGDRLSFGFLKAGARAYIAVSGGIDVP